MNESCNPDPGAEVIVEADVELALALAPRDVGVSVAVGAVLEITVSALTRNPLAHLLLGGHNVDVLLQTVQVHGDPLRGEVLGVLAVVLLWPTLQPPPAVVAVNHVACNIVMTIIASVTRITNINMTIMSPSSHEATK